MANKNETNSHPDPNLPTTETPVHTDICYFSASEFPSKRDLLPPPKETPKPIEKSFVSTQPETPQCPNQKPRTVTRETPRRFN
jgi:hypothetical protein